MKDFDKVYKQYDHFMNLFKLYKVKEIKEALELKGNEIIVDIGGGTGYLGTYLSADCKTVYVLDESEKMLSKVKFNEKVIPVLGNGWKTNFRENSIDIVILSDVLHHIENQEKLIGEIHRILHKKGKLLVLDFDKRYFKTKLLRIFEFLIFGKLYFRTRNQVIHLLEKKFSIRKQIDRGYYFIILGEKR